MPTTSKTVLITGATAGIGRTTALHLAREGHHVIATGRKATELAKLAAEAVAAVDELTHGAGPGVLVNNAGFGILGPSAEISDAELRRQFDTNVFGLMAVTRAFLPKMRERRAGRIINVSSMGGRITLPYFGVYNSTKYAIESLSDALRYELRPFGIDVALIEPGVIRTNFEATAVADLAAFEKTPYKKALDKYEQMSKMADRFASNPIVIAKAISRAVRARRPAARYVAPRSTNAILWFRALAPTSVWDWAMRKMGYLNPKTLGLAPTPASKAEAEAATAPAPAPVSKKAPEAAAAVN
jgi:short-subunit dehydrogenase